MGHHWKAASTSRVAAWVPLGASMTMVDTSWKVPQSQLRLEVSISELSDGQRSSLWGYEKSCISRNSPGVDFGTTPRGDVRNGPISASRRSGEKGPEYLPQESSFLMYVVISRGCWMAEE